MSWKKIVSGSAWLLINHISWRGSMLLSSIILSALLPVDEFAEYAYFQLTAAMIATFATMGMGVSVTKWFAEINSQKESVKVGFLWLLSLLFSVSFSLIVLILPEKWLLGNINIPIELLVIGIFVFSINIFTTSAIQGLERYKDSVWISIGSGLILILGAIFIVPIGGAKYAILFLIFSSVFQFLGCSFVIIKKITFKKVWSSSRPDRNTVSMVIKLAGPMVVVSVMAASGTWLLGKFILIFTQSDRLFSSYAIGMQWFSFALLLPGVMAKVVMPYFVRSQNDIQKTALMLRGNILVSLGISVIVCFGAALFSPFLMSFYGESYAVPYLVLYYCLAAVPVSPINLIGSALIARGAQMSWLILTTIWFFLLILFSLIFKDFSGMAPLTLFSSYAVFACFAFYVAASKKLI